VIDGVQYYAISRTTAFFPISSGRFTIGQAGVRYLVDDFGSFSRDPFSLFSRDPFRRREGVAATDPIQIEVLPLPSDGRPSDFSGAVGDFRLRVVPSADEIRVGESVTLSVRIEGRGNIKSISEIPLPKFDGFRVFAPKARDSVRVEQGRIGGAKIFDLVLVPEVMGSFSLAGITLSYFDPVKGAYVRKDAAPVELRVLEGDEYTMRALAATGERRMARQDIRHIRRVAAITDDLTLLPAGATGGFLRVAPLVAALAGVVVMLQRRHMATTGKAKVRKAFKDLLRDLDEARRIAEGRGTGDASALISRAIRGYIASRKASSESLVDACYVGSLAEISAGRRAEISDLLSILDQARFAPAASGAGEMVALVARAEALMKKVDGEWRD
jgi:hypothetical protein